MSQPSTNRSGFNHVKLSETMGSGSAYRIQPSAFNGLWEEVYDDVEGDENVDQNGGDCMNLSPFRLPEQRGRNLGKLTVVLDLDETLIHTVCEREDPEFYKQVSSYPHAFDLILDGSRAKVLKRPYLDSFLKLASRRYELIAFTAGTENYCNAIVSCLDPGQQYFYHKLHRGHCRHLKPNTWKKDLTIINRDMRRLVLVDNNPMSFQQDQFLNCIRIRSFEKGMNNLFQDEQLIVLESVLRILEVQADVRQGIAKIGDGRLKVVC